MWGRVTRCVALVVSRLSAPSLCLATIGACTVLLTAQQPPAGPPLFRSGIELLPVDVSVLDGAGRAVPDLQADDFVVTLDGRPRTVRFARFYGSVPEATARPAAPDAVVDEDAPPQHVSNTAGPPGRVVIFAVDRDLLRAGSGKFVLHTAAALLDRLTPADAVGFVGLPVGAMTLERNHDRVRRAIESAVGTRRDPPHWRYRIEFGEALAFERRDTTAIRDVLERECLLDTPDCPLRVSDQAREMLFTIRADTQSTLAALRQVLGYLRDIDGPKQVVLLSGGLWFEQEMLTEFNLIKSEAAAARVLVHAILVDQVLFDVEDRGRASSAFARSERQDGLRQLAASTGGAFYHAVGRAEGVFEQVAAETMSVYQLGVETRPDDARATPHALRVRVSRPGLTVRSRSHVLAAAPSQAATPDARLRALLQQPIDVPELPIALASYSTRGGTLATSKVILAAEVGPWASRPASIEWAWAIFRDDRRVADGRSRSAATGNEPTIIVTAAELPPGRYRVRFAAVAPDGRGGTIEAALPVGLHGSGEIQLSDVIVGRMTDAGFEPRSSFKTGGDLHALIELYASEARALERATVRWKLYRRPDAQPVSVVESGSQTSASPGRRVSELHLVVPDRIGDYVLSVVASLDGRPFGQVSRSLQVTP